MIKKGDRVLYTLSGKDAEAVNRRRTDGRSIASRLTMKMSGPEGEIAAWPSGAQAHIGTDVAAGEQYPGVVVQLRDGGEGTPDCVNLQVFLNGNDVFWATARFEGDGPGMFMRQR